VVSVWRAIGLMAAVITAAVGVSACSTSPVTSPAQGSPAALHQLQEAVRVTEAEGTAGFKSVQVSAPASQSGFAQSVATGYIQFSGPNVQTSTRVSSRPNQLGQPHTTLVFGRAIYIQSSPTKWARGRLPQPYSIFGALDATTLTKGTATVEDMGTRIIAGVKYVEFVVHEPAVTVTLGQVQETVHPYLVSVWVDNHGRLARTSATQVVSVRGRSGQTAGSYTTTLSDFGVAFNPLVPPASELVTS
jgi:hypothetical protein